MAQAKVKINRIKEVLLRQDKTQLWLATQLGYSAHAINLICNNKTQPSLQDLLRIANLLGVDIKDLLYSSMPKKNPD